MNPRVWPFFFSVPSVVIVGLLVYFLPLGSIGGMRGTVIALTIVVAFFCLSFFEKSVHIIEDSAVDGEVIYLAFLSFFFATPCFIVGHYSFYDFAGEINGVDPYVMSFFVTILMMFPLMFFGFVLIFCADKIFGTKIPSDKDSVSQKTN